MNVDTMDMPKVTVPVRIRFTGTESADTFHMTENECRRFHAEWNAYLSGGGAIGGEYSSEESEHPLLISLNFTQIAYIEPGRIY